MRKAIIAIFAIAVTACGSAPVLDGSPFQYKEITSKTDAVLYIYRPAKKISSCCWPRVSFQGVPVVDLPNGSYSILKVEPGVHEVSFLYQRGTLESPKRASMKFDKTAKFEFEAGKEYFVKFNVISGQDLAVSYIGGSAVAYSENQLVDMLLISMSKDSALPELSGTREVSPILPRVNL